MRGPGYAETTVGLSQKSWLKLNALPGADLHSWHVVSQAANADAVPLASARRPGNPDCFAGHGHVWFMGSLIVDAYRCAYPEGRLVNEKRVGHTRRFP